MRRGTLEPALEQHNGQPRFEGRASHEPACGRHPDHGGRARGARSRG